jgi:hypothetical protein
VAEKLTIQGIKLAPGEEVFFNGAAALVEERTVTAGYKGGSHGISLRICKGLSYRVGAHRGTFERSRQYIAVSTGTLTLTGHRIIYSAAAKSFTLNCAAVELYELADDCLIVGPAGKPRFLRCVLPADARQRLTAALGFTPTITQGAIFGGSKPRGCLGRAFRALLVILLIGLGLAMLDAVLSRRKKTPPVSLTPVSIPTENPPPPVTAPLWQVVDAPPPAPASTPLLQADVAAPPTRHKAAEVGQVVTLTLRSGRIMKGEVTAIGGTEVAIKSLTQAATVTIARGSLTPESASSVFGD